MRFMRSLDVLFSDLDLFLRSIHPIYKKFRIILIWFKINFIMLFFSRFFNLKKERFLGYDIEAFDYGTIRFLFNEIFVKNEYYFFSKNKHPVIFDCGANIGFASLYFKWLYPECEIHAFEPDKTTFDLLCRNIKINGLKNVYLYNKAVSDKNGRIDFYVNQKTPGSLIMSTDPKRIAGNQKIKIRVDSIRLSSIIKQNNIKNIDFLKLDVEGSENLVIKDLSESRQIKKVSASCIEYHHKIGGKKSELGEFLSILQRNGFEYQISTRPIPLSNNGQFQDIMLSVYR